MHRCFGLLGFSVAVLVAAANADAQIVVGTFNGSVGYSQQINGYVAYVDISSGLLRPVVTAPLPSSSQCAQVDSAVALTTTVDFATANHTVLAINANLGPPNPPYVPGTCGNPYGLLKDDGVYLMPVEIVNGTVGPSLIFFDSATAMIGTPTQPQADSAQWAVSGWTGQGGGTALLIGGQNSGNTAQPVPNEIAPRIGVGITQDGKTLIIVMVNGVESKGIGLELYDFADLLKGLGAWNAVNLDGGGSSTFLYQPRGVIMRTPALMQLFNAATPVPGNPNNLTWSLTAVPATANCISYPGGAVTPGAPLCIDSPLTGYRAIYASFGFTSPLNR